MVSLIILGKSIPKKLKTCLNNQTYRDFEVILAPEEGIVNAMNIALAKAKGDIFVRIDTDVTLSKHWLKELVKPFNNPTVAGVTGVTFVNKELRANRDSIRVMENPPRFLRWMFDGRPYARAKIYNCGSVSYGSNYKELMEDNYDIDHLEGTNWAMRTELIRKVGGFDPAFDGVSEWFDDDVLFKIKKLAWGSQGAFCKSIQKHAIITHSYFKIVYAPKAILYHNLDKHTMNFNKRKEGWSRIRNWLRFHWRHSKFHYKKVIWFLFLVIYTIKNRKSQ